jgi:hypothetical protein
MVAVPLPLSVSEPVGTGCAPLTPLLNATAETVSSAAAANRLNFVNRTIRGLHQPVKIG